MSKWKLAKFRLTVIGFSIRRQLTSFQSDFVEIWQVLLAFFVAFWLIFLVDPTNPIYTGVFNLQTNTYMHLIWSSVFLIRALLGVYALSTKNKQCLKWSAFLGISLLAMIVSSLFSADIMFISNAAWLTLMLLQISSYVRMVTDNDRIT